MAAARHQPNEGDAIPKTEPEPPLVCTLIRQERERAGKTQQQMAVALGMSLGGYAAYEIRREPPPERRRQLAQVLGLEEDAFELGLTRAQVDQHMGKLDDLLARFEDAIDRVLPLLEGRESSPGPPEER
jgi:transcriptional regulator with XRE-family HTH domain